MAADELTDEEYAELKRNRAKLQQIIAQHGEEATKQMIKDALDYPRKSGDLKD